MISPGECAASPGQDQARPSWVTPGPGHVGQRKLDMRQRSTCRPVKKRNVAKICCQREPFPEHFSCTSSKQRKAPVES